MSGVALRLGALQAPGFAVQRSGISWLCTDGHVCRANEIVAYCNISLEGLPGQHALNPFRDERELQVALAPRVAGRVRISGDAIGGHLSVHGVQPWRADEVIGAIEPIDDVDVAEGDTPRLLMLAGRRTTGLAAVETGLLSGWHSRSRGWWSDAAGSVGPTLLSLGICDCHGPVRGDSGAFGELFEAAPFPAQVVYIPDQPLTPCAPTLAEGFIRTPDQFRAIAADMQAGLLASPIAATPEDWLFAGTFLGALERSPMRDRYDLLTPGGVRQAGPAEAILLSLNSEFQTLLRHKQLGYTVHVMRHHRLAAGPAVQAWLNAAFEPVRRSIADIRRDYARLFTLVGGETGARFLIVNRMSTSGQEDITSYAAFDAPMSATLETVLAKELNLMLHDLALEHDIDIIDVDAIAGEVGAALHLPDGMHQSGFVQDVIRADILRCMA